MTDTQSDYERQRQENIARNNALLRELALQDLGSSLVEAAAQSRASSKRMSPVAATRSHKKTRSTRSLQRATAAEKTVLPLRHSARLAGLKPGADAESDPLIKAEKEYAAEAQARYEKSRARVAGDIKFEDISPEQVSSLWTFDDDDGRFKRDDEDTIHVEAAETPKLAKDIVQLRKDMSGMKLYNRFVPNDIKITPERVYHIEFHPSAAKRIVLAADKIGHLGVWDVDSAKTTTNDDDEEEEQPQLYLYKVHARTVSHFTFAPGVHDKVYTASYDGSIRCVDFKSGLSTEVYYGGDDDAVSEIHFANPNVVYFSTLFGEVGRKDLRSKDDVEKYRMHEKKIGGMSLHPRAPHLCATASLDRTMKLWDFRHIRKRYDDLGGQQPDFLGEYTSRLSVSCAAWNTQGGLVCNGYDDTINVFDLKDAASWGKMHIFEDGLKPSATIRHNCQTGKWVTILRSQWQDDPRDNVQKFVIGNMKRFMDIFTADGVQLARLGDDELITAVPAACKLHPSKNWIVGATASAKVCLFE
ncbi:WD40-repeat-containing domain protein [Limtongia smithiae]|uniref:WD40-repeat-containing domain protein n=1 Tax=Limtongia smithiae TaxID=1125753 RepID=UPI0034CE78F8